MNLDALSCLDGRPLLSELLHHFFPHKERLIGQLIDSLLRLFLELEQPEASLDDCGFGH